MTPTFIANLWDQSVNDFGKIDGGIVAGFIILMIGLLGLGWGARTIQKTLGKDIKF